MSSEKQTETYISSPIENEEFFNPDRVAAHRANEAWKAGRWLAWAEQGGQEATREAKLMLGGRYDRALGDVGLDGTVLAQDKKLFDEVDMSGKFVMDITTSDAERSENEKRLIALGRRHEFHTSPVVREHERLLSSTPVEVEQDPSNIVMVWTSGNFYTPAGDMVEHEGDEWSRYKTSEMTFTIPAGKRLVIDNLPKGSKRDRAYTEQHPLQRMQVQIYHNAQGYLIADKVFNNGFGPEVFKKREISLVVSQTGEGFQIDQDAPEKPAMESLWASNDRKQEFINPVDPRNKYIQLLKTTSEFNIDERTYNNFETIISTIDDSGDQVDVMIECNTGYPPEELGPIIFRVIDGTDTEVAHHMYQ